MKESRFLRFSNALSQITGRASTFIIAVVMVIAWAFSGPLFHFSDTWQLVINTSTTIVTFFMVFPIRNTQNRFARESNAISGCRRAKRRIFMPVAALWMSTHATLPSFLSAD